MKEKKRRQVRREDLRSWLKNLREFGSQYYKILVEQNGVESKIQDLSLVAILGNSRLGNLLILDSKMFVESVWVCVCMFSLLILHKPR